MGQVGLVGLAPNLLPPARLARLPTARIIPTTFSYWTWSATLLSNTLMNNADIAWMLVSTALVLLMTPALGFFYGGMVRSKNALNTMMMSFVALGPVAVAWALLGYSLAFAPGAPFVGSLAFAGLHGVGLEAQGTIPHLLFMAFQGTFAIITAALISGAVVERLRFHAYLAFIVAWVLLVYAPVAHWVWGGGFLAGLGALDFAGGAVVHVNAAAAALVAALVVGPRKDYGRHAILPHNVPFTLLGAGLLWFGWFGFNAGSALAAWPIGALAFANTLLAPAATLATWTLIDLLRGGRVTAIGAATAIVVGLVVVTPAAGYIGPASALAMGALGAVPSYFALIYRARTKLDDSLDVVAAHGTRRRDRRDADRRVRRAGVERRRQRPARRQSRTGADPGPQRARRAGLQRHRHIRDPQGARAGDAAADQQARRGRRPRRHRTRRGGLHRRRRRDPRPARRRDVRARGERRGRRLNLVFI